MSLLIRTLVALATVVLSLGLLYQLFRNQAAPFMKV
jgi:hypothetical protein